MAAYRRAAVLPAGGEEVGASRSGGVVHVLVHKIVAHPKRSAAQLKDALGGDGAQPLDLSAMVERCGVRHMYMHLHRCVAAGWGHQLRQLGLAEPEREICVVKRQTRLCEGALEEHLTLVLHYHGDACRTADGKRWGHGH